MTDLSNLISMEEIEAIVQGQAERNIKKQSRKNYLSKCISICRVLMRVPELFAATIEHVDGIPQFHTGEAHKLHKFKLPMTAEAVAKIFGLLAISADLAKRGRRPSQNLPRQPDDNTNAPFAAAIEVAEDEINDEAIGNGEETDEAPVETAVLPVQVEVSFEIQPVSIADRRDPGN